MTIDINQFWHLLSESKLVELSKIQPLIEEFDTAFSKTSDAISTATDAANWLQKKQLLTSYQAQILLAGHSGPIRFGDYVVTDQFTSTPANADFSGKHLATNFPVHLQFMAGSHQSDLELWKQIEDLADKVSQIDEPNLVWVFESVVLPEYRFVASQARRGKRLSELVPRKGRMPWQDACVIMAHVARALDRLHQHAIVHNAISPRFIWVGAGGKSKLEMALNPDKSFGKPTSDYGECRLDYLAPEVLSESHQITARSDLYAFGCTLYRIIAGKTVFPGTDLDRKSKQHLSHEPAPLEERYKVPPELLELVDRLLAKEPDRRPESAAAVASQLCQLAGRPDLLNESDTESVDKLQTFRELLHRNKFDTFAITGSPRAQTVDFPGDLQTLENAKIATATHALPTEDRFATIAARRKRAKWKMPLAVATALAIMSGFIGLFAYYANETALVLPPEPVAPAEENVQPVVLPPIEATPLVNPNLVQVLIEDDDVSLWETPTTGPPLNLEFHPPTPRIVFAFRPAELLSHVEGTQLMRSLGPDLNQRIENWREQLGLDFEDMEQLIISLHSGPQSAYESFASVRLTRPTMADELMKALGNPTAEGVGDVTLYTKPGGMAFYLIPEQAKVESVDESANRDVKETGEVKSLDEANEVSPPITRFVFGNTAAVREVAQASGVNVLSGSIKKLVDRSDANRHFSLLFLRPALFNEQGQSLMAGQLATFNRQLDLFLQDEIRGCLLSFHIDQGDYFEIVFDQTVDLESRDLKESLETSLRIFRDEVTRFLATIPANQYWDKVRLRYDNMLADVYRNLRWDVEFGALVGNCWLPPMAGHNLVGASELVTAFSADLASGSAVVAAKKIPASLEELLQTRRSLRVTTNPDLNLLLSGIRAEILDEFGDLPFDFQFHFIGNELQKEGITQNQRPGDFQINDKSLAEILTEIMVRCNPDKSISGARDPNCKLVWVFGPAPSDPEKRAILITTRAGAAAQDLTLPNNFQPQ